MATHKVNPQPKAIARLMSELNRATRGLLAGELAGMHPAEEKATVILALLTLADAHADSLPGPERSALGALVPKVRLLVAPQIPDIDDMLRKAMLRAPGKFKL